MKALCEFVNVPFGADGERQVRQPHPLDGGCELNRSESTFVAPRVPRPGGAAR